MTTAEVWNLSLQLGSLDDDDDEGIAFILEFVTAIIMAIEDDTAIIMAIEDDTIIIEGEDMVD